ncbi:hypothetical protein F5888DRAFT_1705870 [Russula emetica]|nr:hypothetical protein F5888DRAFT_1705870 [Russula emetica]
MTVHPPAPAPTSTSSSTSTPTSPQQVTSAREAVFKLLSSTISGSPVALTTVERGTLLAGITAFRGVRETLLWFFDDGANANEGAGILTDGRPAEFWALEDLARGEAGVRVRTATGRTCSVVLMRRRSGDDDGEEQEQEQEEGEETEFQMIDGKERERILEWVRRHRGAFGIAKIAQAQAPLRGAANGSGKEEETGKDKREDSDSDSDSDFEESEESDGGSPSSSNSSGSDEGEDDEPRSEDGGSGTGNESGGDDDEGEGEDDDDDEEITMQLDDPDPDPKHHPLLRAGALPKMSRAAMDAAVELVMGDLVGQPGKARRRDAPSAGSGSGLGRPPAGDGYEGAVAVAGADDDDDEDELED